MPTRANFAASRRLTLILTVALLSIVITVTAAELLVRIVNPTMSYPYMPQQIYVSHFRSSSLLPAELRLHSSSRFKMLEFDTTVTTNSIGLRDNEVDFSKPRIICMGDSFTFGVGVEDDETFCAILERLFQGKYDFINAGFADGFSPDTYALWLSQNRQTLSPTGVIVFFFQNDLDDVNANVWIKNGKVMAFEEKGFPDQIKKPGFIITEDGASIRDSFIARMPPSVRRLIKRSYLIAFLRDRFLHDTVWKEWSYQPQGTDPQQYRKFVRSLDLLREAADDRLLGFYLIPMFGQTAQTQMDNIVANYAANHGIPVFSNPRDLTADDYFKVDRHFSPSGHLKTARYLHKALSDRGL